MAMVDIIRNRDVIVYFELIHSTLHGFTGVEMMTLDIHLMFSSALWNFRIVLKSSLNLFLNFFPYKISENFKFFLTVKFKLTDLLKKFKFLGAVKV